LHPAGGSTVTGTVDVEETATGVQLWVSVTAPRGFYAVHLRGRPDCADVAGSDARTTDRGERLGLVAVTDAGSGSFERRLDGASLDDVSKSHSLFGRSVVLFRQNHLAPPRSDGERAVACGPVSR
jgi:hypothetical protein